VNEDSNSLTNRLRALPRPRAATVIALLALTMAMGGTSLAGSVLSGSALTNGSVGRSKIAANAIDSTRLAAHAVTTAKLAKGAVDASRLAKAAVTAAALKPGSVTSSALAPGAVAGSNLAPSAVSWKSLGAQVVAAAPVTLPVGTTSDVPVTATASCPSGMVAISGGESLSDLAFAFVIQSVQVSLPGAAPTGWTATGATVGNLAATMTVYAICINAGV
jgi:hypothetical protein